MENKQSLWINLNRLIVITLLLLGMKLFNYFIVDFLPVFGQVLGKLAIAFLPFILALLIAYILEPVVTRLISVLHIRRSYAAILSLLLVISLVGFVMFVIIARLYTELSDLAISWPNYNYIIEALQNNVNAIEHYIELNPQVQSTLYSTMEGLLKSIQDWAKSGSIFLLSVLASLPGLFIVLVVSIVASLLVSASFPKVVRFVRSLYPKRWHDSLQMITRDLGSALMGFLRAEAMLVTVTAIMTIIGLLIIGNRYALTIGVIAGFLDLLPIVGTGILFLPWIVILFMMGAIGEGLKLALIWVVTIVIRQFLEPKIMAKSIGLHPLPTLISMYVGLQLFGAVGLILGPTTVIIYEAVRKSGLLNHRKN